MPTACFKIAVTKAKSHESMNIANTSQTTKGSFLQLWIAEMRRAELVLVPTSIAAENGLIYSRK
jgi:hypothetical protein